MLIIGLTGGIASGKSTATDYFRSLGVPVVDADEISRELAVPGMPAFTAIIEAFGKEYIDTDGQLDRSRLRRLVFSDSTQRSRLEKILHPRIREEIQHRLTTINAPYCVVSIPLLIETGQTDIVDRVLVIDTPVDIQINRLQQRETMNDNEIQAILNSQTSRQSRLEEADDTILNNDTITGLQEKLGALHHKYLALASVPDH